MSLPRSHDERLVLLRHLADPVRLGVLDRLLEHGPAGASELAARLDIPAPQLSNHLRRLREAGLVDVDRHGRQATYRIAGTRVAPLLRLLDDLIRVPVAAPTATPPFVRARTCYDHLAGRLGVALCDRLLELEAVTAQDDHLEQGPTGAEVLSRLGVRIDDLPVARRAWATSCQDATEGRPHLGGALGAAIARGLLDRGWTRVHVDRREVEVTGVGRRGLRRQLQLDADFAVCA